MSREAATCLCWRRTSVALRVAALRPPRPEACQSASNACAACSLGSRRAAEPQVIDVHHATASRPSMRSAAGGLGGRPTAIAARRAQWSLGRLLMVALLVVALGALLCGDCAPTPRGIAPTAVPAPARVAPGEPTSGASARLDATWRLLGTSVTTIGARAMIGSEPT